MGKRPAPHPAVYVEWVDSCYQQGEATPDELGGPLLLHTLGWLVREAEDHLTVALERRGGGACYRFLIHIPRVCVRRVRRVTL